MGKKYQRRVAELLKIHLARLLRREVNDVRLRGVTIMDVRVNPDTTQADVYFTTLGDSEDQEEVLAGLEGAAGFLRRELGKSLRLRNIPELRFHWDQALERGERIANILDQLHEEEGQL